MKCIPRTQELRPSQETWNALLPYLVPLLFKTLVGTIREGANSKYFRSKKNTIRDSFSKNIYIYHSWLKCLFVQLNLIKLV